jgi:hypothetical protein
MGLFFSEFVRSVLVVNEFLCSTFFYKCDGIGNRIGWSAWSRREKIERQPQKQIEQSRKISNILYKFKHIFIKYPFSMATKKKSTTTVTASMEPPSTRLSRLPYARMVQNFPLLWLDGSIDEQNNDDCRNNITSASLRSATPDCSILLDKILAFHLWTWLLYSSIFWNFHSR